MSLQIVSLATASPRHHIPQDEAAEIAQLFCNPDATQGRMLSALYRRTRVKQRGSVLLENPAGREPRQTFFPQRQHDSDGGPPTSQRLERYASEAGPLVIPAAQQALAQADLPADRITHLVTVSCTGFAAPGVDVELIQSLGLSPEVQRAHVGFMGCHGAINGLRVAEGFCRLGPDVRVLVCAVELCSLHFFYGWEPEKLVANALFADGAAALVVAPSEHAPPLGWRMRGTGSCLFPNSTEAMTWRIGDHGFLMTLSSQVPELIATQLRPWLEGWLAKQNLTLDQIGSWAVHPGGPRILSSVGAALDLPPEALATSQAVLAEHGNMSSPTLLFILQRLAAANATRPCVALGFGPGLVAEVMVLD